MDFRVNYKCIGVGIPFVFQHGLAANLDQPQNLLSGIHNVKLISMDVPGHGATPIPENTVPSFQYYANQILELMEKLRVKKAILGGISMGAGIALNMALNNPEKVMALVLIRPAWLDQEKPENLKILQCAAQCMDHTKGMEHFLKQSEIQHLKTTLPLAAQSLLGVFDTTQQNEIPLVLKSLVNDKPFENISTLRQIEQPCLVIGNDDDPLHPFEIAEKTHHHLQKSQLYKVVSRYLDNTEHQSSIKEIVSKFITKYEELLEG